MDLPEHWVAYELPPDPDLAMLLRYGTPDLLAQIHRRYWGATTPATIRRWPLTWIKRHGRNMAAVAPFIREAARQSENRPLPPIAEAIRQQLADEQLILPGLDDWPGHPQAPSACLSASMKRPAVSVKNRDTTARRQARDSPKHFANEPERKGHAGRLNRGGFLIVQHRRW